MGIILEIFGGQFAVDRQATVEAYSRIAIPGPEECACLYCRNWVAGREKLLSPGVREMLFQFGVPPNGEIEVWRVPGVQKAHGYGGWYTVVGEILQTQQDELSLEGWTVTFAAGRSYNVPAFAGQAVFEISFFTEADSFIPGEY